MQSDYEPTNRQETCEASRKSSRWAVSCFAAIISVCIILQTFATATQPKPAPSDEIRAARFVVANRAGQERGQFGVSDSGEVSLRMWDEGRTMEATVEIDAQGIPRVSLARFGREPLAEMLVFEGGHPLLILRDAEERRRFGIAVGDRNAIGLNFYDSNDVVRCRIGLGENGQPRIALMNAKGKTLASLLTDDKGGTGLDLYDGEGRARAVIQVDANGEPDMALLSGDLKRLWSARNQSEERLESGKENGQ
jgi:hypothetical protein